ncbi:hypothetical protein pipiens_019656 [Culex pipiens pipiens]|uniref:Uncharacterized protein n=1 Tax=Culex pipiens pipiens TaxID=38569 RepID=A0ABD1DTG4_CULPP
MLVDENDSQVNKLISLDMPQQTTPDSADHLCWHSDSHGPVTVLDLICVVVLAHCSRRKQETLQLQPWWPMEPVRTGPESSVTRSWTRCARPH